MIRMYFSNNVVHPKKIRIFIPCSCQITAYLITYLTMVNCSGSVCHWILWQKHINMSTGKYGSNFKSVIFKLIIQNSSMGFRCLIALRWMPQDLTDEKSTLVQVIAWCHQATSHNLSQCWPGPYCHVASLGHNELRNTVQITNNMERAPIVLYHLEQT